MTEQRLLTVRMAAADAGVTKNTIYAIAARGEIQLRKIGGKTVIPRDEWDAYLRALPVARLATKS